MNHDKVFLILVDPDNNGIQSNKYYNMEKSGPNFISKWGRVGGREDVKTYPLHRFNSVYNSKLKKGYRDITELKIQKVKQVSTSGNIDFNKFYDHFKTYTGSFVSKNYVVDNCTPQQLEEAQDLIDKLVKSKNLKKSNDLLVELFRIIPRKMGNVRDYLISVEDQILPTVKREQDALDAMDSSNIIQGVNPLDDLNIEFKEIKVPKNLKKMIEGSMSGTRHGQTAEIHKCFEVVDKSRIKVFDDWVSNQKDKSTEYLIHGTRNANIFSILKSGLLIRPSNAASFAGSAYGDGIYHSAHAAKSLGYTGGDSDKIFFIQDVHMGKPYTYSGWYKAGKDIDRNQMNYSGVQALGCDSLYVEPGGGLLNSEYIVYNYEQSITKYLIWLK